MNQDVFSNKDWAYLIVSALTISVALGTFIWRLCADLKIARYRETLAYFDKKYDILNDEWKDIESDSASYETKKAYLNRLEHISHLVCEKVFSEALVYDSLWMHFCYPLQRNDLAALIRELKKKDKKVFIHYIKLSKKWFPKIAREQGLT